MWELVAQLVAQFRERMLPRRRLPAFSTIEHAVGLVQRARRIVVLSGAGISVSAGIPDFRSKHGVYQLVEERFDLPDPQSLFDIHYFVDDPVPFFTFAKNLYPGTYSPTPAHYFIRALEQREKLLCNYTQNIDTLEKVAGIERKVTCHGSFETASCLACKHTVPCDEIHTDIVAGRVPTCPRCTHELNILKPDIVFFGEPLGEGFERHIQDDLPQCDLLVVMGSSMRVQPVATIPSMLARDVPQILINRELVMSPHQFDVELLGARAAARGARRLRAPAAHRARARLAPELGGVPPACAPRALRAARRRRSRGGGGTGNCDAIVHELCDRLGWQLPVGPSAAATSAPAGGRPSAEHVAGAPGAPSAAPPTGVGSGSAAGAPAAPAAAGGSAAAPGRFEFEPPNRYLFEGAVRPSMPIPPSPAGAGAPAASPAGPDPPVPEAEAQRGQPAAMPAADAAAGGGAGALGDATAAVAPAEVGVPNAAEDVSPVPAASVLLEAGV